MGVRVITDSTADIPSGVAASLGIRVVPIYVRFGEQTYRDGVDLSTGEFYRMLASSGFHPATSQPNPEDFAGVYREYCNQSDGIISIHISSKISGTFNSARLACRTMSSACPIEVIDSQFNSAGLGLITMAAARLAQTGATLAEVLAETRRAVGQVGMFGLFSTMKYLARSGRVNKTIAAASRLLNVMPLLTFREGEILRAGLVRTINHGIERIEDFVKQKTPLSDLTIVHSAASEQAQTLKKRLSRFVAAEKVMITELGAGLGVHGGPGVLLVALRQRD